MPSDIDWGSFRPDASGLIAAASARRGEKERDGRAKSQIVNGSANGTKAARCGVTFYGRSLCDHFLRSAMLSPNRSSASFPRHN